MPRRPPSAPPAVPANSPILEWFDEPDILLPTREGTTKVLVRRVVETDRTNLWLRWKTAGGFQNIKVGCTDAHANRTIMEESVRALVLERSPELSLPAPEPEVNQELDWGYIDPILVGGVSVATEWLSQAGRSHWTLTWDYDGRQITVTMPHEDRHLKQAVVEADVRALVLATCPDLDVRPAGACTSIAETDFTPAQQAILAALEEEALRSSYARYALVRGRKKNLIVQWRWTGQDNRPEFLSAEVTPDGDKVAVRPRGKGQHQIAVARLRTVAKRLLRERVAASIVSPQPEPEPAEQVRAALAVYGIEISDLHQEAEGTGRIAITGKAAVAGGRGARFIIELGALRNWWNLEAGWECADDRDCREGPTSLENVAEALAALVRDVPEMAEERWPTVSVAHEERHLDQATMGSGARALVLATDPGLEGPPEPEPTTAERVRVALSVNGVDCSDLHELVDGAGRVHVSGRATVAGGRAAQFLVVLDGSGWWSVYSGWRCVDDKELAVGPSDLEGGTQALADFVKGGQGGATTATLSAPVADSKQNITVMYADPVDAGGVEVRVRFVETLSGLTAWWLTWICFAGNSAGEWKRGFLPLTADNSTWEGLVMETTAEVKRQAGLKAHASPAPRLCHLEADAEFVAGLTPVAATLLERDDGNAWLLRWSRGEVGYEAAIPGGRVWDRWAERSASRAVYERSPEVFLDYATAEADDLDAFAGRCSLSEPYVYARLAARLDHRGRVILDGQCVVPLYSEDRRGRITTSERHYRFRGTWDGFDWTGGYSSDDVTLLMVPGAPQPLPFGRPHLLVAGDIRRRAEDTPWSPDPNCWRWDQKRVQDLRAADQALRQLALAA